MSEERSNELLRKETVLDIVNRIINNEGTSYEKVEMIRSVIQVVYERMVDKNDSVS